ncbi:OprD family outer membrane porin [Sulfurihydrogenibium azorense]|uniref:OprD family outer membrane porin n=1 Tax=Sulfurihydrogenibium azorense TaxID=309806 RepID=UPI002409693F|nr:OprD family outer membrane porin [Sulfurihydrogenibium azorense]MDM7273989.1 OprD family outer membrane porin [Sulfurihydrogenibium azorense]
MRKPLLTSLLLSTSVMAADDIFSAIKESKFSGSIRAKYFLTDWEDESKTTGVCPATAPTCKDAKGFSFGGGLSMQTAPLYNFTAKVSFWTVTGFGWTKKSDGYTATTSLDLFKNGAYGQGYSVLAESYVEYNDKTNMVRVGRTEYKNPFFDSNDTKMIPATFEGAFITSKIIPNTVVEFDYLTKMKQRRDTEFGKLTDTIDTPIAIKKHYANSNNPPDFMVIGIKNESIKNLTLEAHYAHWWNIVDQLRLEGNYTFKTGDFKHSFGVRGYLQYDDGAGKIIKPKDSKLGDNDNSIDSWLYAVRYILDYKDVKLLLAYSQTSTKGDIIAPFRGFPTDGYTRSMTQTDWNAGTKAYKVGIDYKVPQVKGLLLQLSYSYYNRDESKVPYQNMTNRGFNNGDTKQWNLDITERFEGKLKGLMLRGRFMIQDNDKTTVCLLAPSDYRTRCNKNTNNKEMRLEMVYNF